MDSQTEVQDRLQRRTTNVVGDLREAWGVTRSVDPVEYGPLPWYPDQVPESVAEQLETFAGIASVVTFYTDTRQETVLVYNRAGYWEPPGGAIEGRRLPAETAGWEAEEATGLDAELTDLLYTGEVHYQYDDGETVVLPLAAFVGHRTAGQLRVERERNDHPGVCRGVGLFGPDVLPEDCRDREHLLRLLPAGDGSDAGVR